jgi:hypothetical protein
MAASWALILMPTSLKLTSPIIKGESTRISLGKKTFPQKNNIFVMPISTWNCISAREIRLTSRRLRTISKKLRAPLEPPSPLTIFATKLTYVLVTYGSTPTIGGMALNSLHLIYLILDIMLSNITNGLNSKGIIPMMR